MHFCLVSEVTNNLQTKEDSAQEMAEPSLEKPEGNQRDKDCISESEETKMKQGESHKSRKRSESHEGNLAQISFICSVQQAS